MDEYEEDEQLRVTDKKYWMEKNIIKKTDFFIKRFNKNFDHLFLYSGGEGIGKSTCAVHHGYYYAHRLGKKFTHKNIFFDPEEMMKFAANTEGEVIMWDEAAFGGLSSQWQNQIQQKLIQCLMTARKKRHFWLFLCPMLNKFNFYFIWRATGIIHVYSNDDITRGRYVYYNKERKEKFIMPQLMNKTKRMLTFKKKYSFRGTWGKDSLIENIIDADAYEKAKDDAIMKAFSGEQVGSRDRESAMRYHMRLYLLSQHCLDNFGMSQADIGRIIKGNYKMVSRGKDLYENHSNMLEIQRPSLRLKTP